VIPALGRPRQFALRQLRSLAEFGGIRSGLDIVPNEESAVAGRIDDEHRRTRASKRRLP
jgi:hypothetical protein